MSGEPPVIAALGQLRVLELLTDAEDAPEVLAEALDATHRLRELQADLERDAVVRARAAGWSWYRIADHLGVTRQAVIKRHGATEVAAQAS
jgi:putative hemolysin